MRQNTFISVMYWVLIFSRSVFLIYILTLKIGRVEWEFDSKCMKILRNAGGCPKHPFALIILIDMHFTFIWYSTLGICNLGYSSSFACQKVTATCFERTKIYLFSSIPWSTLATLVSWKWVIMWESVCIFLLSFMSYYNLLCYSIIFK